MKSRIVYFLMFLAMPYMAMADGGTHGSYRNLLREKLGVVLTLPDEALDSVHDSMPFISFSFGDYFAEGGGRPTFIAGPKVELDGLCSVVLMDVHELRKPRPEALPDNWDYTWPQSVSFMLNNCGSPWASWYIYNRRGVIIEGAVGHSPRELRAMQERVEKLRILHERRIEDGELVGRTGCDRLFIVRIPDIEKMAVSPDDVPENYLAGLKADATECYGVEFYKHSSQTVFLMLFLINGDSTDIEECVAKMAEYIEFE